MDWDNIMCILRTSSRALQAVLCFCIVVQLVPTKQAAPKSPHCKQPKSHVQTMTPCCTAPCQFLSQIAKP